MVLSIKTLAGRVITPASAFQPARITVSLTADELTALCGLYDFFGDDENPAQSTAAIELTAAHHELTGVEA